jgi:hypothetical protein
MLRSDLTSLAGGSSPCRLKVSRSSADPAGYGTLTVWQYDHNGHLRVFAHRSLSLYAELKARGHRITRQRGDSAHGHTCDISRIGWLFAPTDKMDTIRNNLRPSLLTDSWSDLEQHRPTNRKMTIHGLTNTLSEGSRPSEPPYEAMRDNDLNTEKVNPERNLWLITDD